MRPNKLTVLFLLIILTAMIDQFVSAQIVYTDIKPDVTTSGTYDLDLNNDGTLDQNEFSSACQKGLVKSGSSSGAASGENSSKMAPSKNNMADTKHALLCAARALRARTAL